MSVPPLILFVLAVAVIIVAGWVIEAIQEHRKRSQAAHSERVETEQRLEIEHRLAAVAAGRKTAETVRRILKDSSR